MAISISQFIHRVEIQSYTLTRDEEGGQINTWATDATVWAKVNPVSGREREAADKTDSRLKYRIIMREYEAGLTTDMRIKFGTKIFEIVAIVEPTLRGDFYILDCLQDEQVTS